MDKCDHKDNWTSVGTYFIPTGVELVNVTTILCKRCGEVMNKVTSVTFTNSSNPGGSGRKNIPGVN